MRKGRKVAKLNTVFFQWFVTPEGRKVGSLTGGAEPAGQMRDEKLHAVVARSTFRSQNVHSTPCSDHFWKLRCRKSARRCGCEAHFEVKMLKTLGVWTTFGGSDVASLQYTTLHYTTLHYTTLHYTTLHYTTLQLQLHNYTPLYSTILHYTKLHYTTLHYSTLHSTTLHYTTFHCTSLHYTTLHSTTRQLQLQLHNYIPLQ